VVEELFPDAEPLAGESTCQVTITTGIPTTASHTELCETITYSTNPPSSGDHWPRWAAFGIYDDPVPREMLVHDLEHGAVALLHDCDGCTEEVVDALLEVTVDFGADEKCLGGSSGAVARFIVAPDPDIDHPIALAAWGATYVATCIDPPSLQAFVDEHYATGPEDTCAGGVDPASVLAECE
jgi:hypothetical protein